MKKLALFYRSLISFLFVDNVDKKLFLEADHNMINKLVKECKESGSRMFTCVQDVVDYIKVFNQIKSDELHTGDKSESLILFSDTNTCMKIEVTMLDVPELKYILGENEIEMLKKFANDGIFFVNKMPSIRYRVEEDCILLSVHILRGVTLCIPHSVVCDSKDIPSIFDLKIYDTDEKFAYALLVFDLDHSHYYDFLQWVKTKFMTLNPYTLV